MKQKIKYDVLLLIVGVAIAVIGAFKRNLAYVSVAALIIGFQLGRLESDYEFHDWI